MRAHQVLELGVVESRDQRGVPFAIYAEVRDLQFMGVILQLPGPLPAGLFLGPAAATGSLSLSLCLCLCPRCLCLCLCLYLSLSLSLCLCS